MEPTTVGSLNLDGQTLYIKKGLNDSQIDQLIHFAATDLDLKKFTGDPVRFKDRSGFDEFSKHILAYYVLTDEADNLLGIIWFDDLDIYYLDKKEPSDYGISLGIRLYNEARGKGLAVPFSEKVFEDFKKTQEYLNHPHPKFWLAVSPDNYPAISVYKKLGFKDFDYNRRFNKNLMILE